MKYNSKFPKLERNIPFYGKSSSDYLRNPVRYVELTELLSALIAFYRRQAKCFGGRFDGKIELVQRKL